MDVTAPPDQVVAAPPESASETKPVAPAEEKPKPKAPPKPKQPKTGVGMAVFATVIIVLGLAAMATFAYLKQTNSL